MVPTTPKAALTDRLKEKIKLVMVSRFNKDTKALDLTRLHVDPGKCRVFMSKSKYPNDSY